jgi:hypothetical protein
MVDANERKELEAQISADNRELYQLECCEDDLLQHIPKKGFRAATDRTNMQVRAAALCNSIRKLEQRLKGR